MKKKTVVIGIVIAFVLCVVIIVAILAVQRGGVSMIFAKSKEVKMTKLSNADVAVEGRELTATVGTEEEAKQVAEMYGITFVYFADGIAEYTTDRPINEVIAEGEENGYPRLSINYIRKMTN